MTRSGFSELSGLWQEQVDPPEEERLRLLSRDIVRSAGRRRAIDLLLALIAIGLVTMALFLHPAPAAVRLVLAGVTGFLAWTVWMRQRLFTAARALAVCEPDAFFGAAIGNARAELRYSTLSLWGAAPAALLLFLLLLTPRDRFELDPVAAFGAHPVRMALVLLTLLLGYVFFVRDNFRLREQLRRLEAMSTEWDAEHARDIAESA
jgi:hypothetical protein